jgi:hypothetical protein
MTEPIEPVMKFFPEAPEHLEADYFFTVGPHCRAAGELRENYLKRTRFPLDWQVFSADALIHCMETGFSDYFLEVVEEPFQGEPPQLFYFARDVRNDILSMHDITLRVLLEDAVPAFHNITVKRWNTFCSMMTDNKSVILFGAYPEPEDAQKILRAFQKHFPNIAFHMVNVSHRENCPEDEIYCAHPCDCFDQYYMCEEFVPYEWKGNLPGWKAVLSHYSLKEQDPPAL